MIPDCRYEIVTVCLLSGTLFRPYIYFTTVSGIVGEKKCDFWLAIPKRPAEMAFLQALNDIASKTAISDRQPDAIEGVLAWREKRPAKFNQWIVGS